MRKWRSSGRGGSRRHGSRSAECLRAHGTTRAEVAVREVGSRQGTGGSRAAREALPNPAPSPAKRCSTPVTACARRTRRSRPRGEQLASHRALVDDTKVASHPKSPQRGRRRAARPTSTTGVPKSRPRFRGSSPSAAIQLGQRVSPGNAADGDRADGPGVGGGELQGSGPETHSCRPAGRLDGRCQRQWSITAAWSASAPAPVRRSRCCRRRTRQATGSRSCSGCPCASRSTRTKSPRIRSPSVCRCRRDRRARSAGQPEPAAAAPDEGLQDSGLCRRRPRVDALIAAHHRENGGNRAVAAESARTIRPERIAAVDQPTAAR